MKLIVAEDGSDIADELWQAADTRISSQLIYPEARAALAAATRTGRIDEPGLRRAITDLDRAAGAMLLVGVDEQLAGEAGRLAQEHALRGYDAVHLATALGNDDRDLVIVTWDHNLARAASRCGHPVAPALQTP